MNFVWWSGLACEAVNAIGSPVGLCPYETPPARTPIVLVNNGSYHLLLDAQQRLATATILMAALRDKINECKNDAVAHLAQVVWSPDSKRVAVVEDYPRSSGRFAAWFDGKTWDKTLQKDEAGAAVLKQAQGFVFVSIAGHRQSILIILEL